ncbi:hypothetical protein [Streptacidiphilus jiangxiensis]|uniref:hypothetical protein n=1 Tax=Streptacidiphilus jiangxiensis TaxID=235985 RepID=UPI0005AA230D|nr:hypothetical protein [Streptacidiphilus jiangxiensis]
MTSRTQRRRRPQPGRKRTQPAPLTQREKRRQERDAELRARVGTDGVPAAGAVRRMWLAYGVVGALALAGVLGPGLLERFHAIRTGAPVAGGLAAFAATMVGQGLSIAWRTVDHGDGARLVTGRTWTGPRTVDLDRLARVRRTRVPTKAGWIDQLWIKDRSGVAFWFADKALAKRVSASVRTTPGARVSRYAAIGLGLEPPLTGAARAARAVRDVVVGLYTPLGATAVGAVVAGIVASS